MSKLILKLKDLKNAKKENKMIYFNLVAHKDIIDNHYEKLRIKLNNRIDSSSLNLQAKSFITENLKLILEGEPAVIKDIDSRFKEIQTHTARIKSKLSKIFDYIGFRTKSNNGDYDAYELALMLGTRTCLYCNRNYTLTISKGYRKTDKITRPEFDHFFDQSDYPLLALSIFNLIPSCKICNSTLKHTKKFTLDNNLHPYKDDVIDFYKYSYVPHDVGSILGGKSELSVKINIVSDDKNLDKKIVNSKNIFKLEDIMSGHAEELKDILEIRHRFSSRYFEELLKKYYLLGLNYEEIYRIVFGTYSLEKDFGKRPFSKLKKDLLKELGII